MRGCSTRLSRRRLLVRAAVLAAGGLVLRVERALAAESRRREAQAPHRLIEGLFCDADAAAGVGRRYLALHPGEADLDGLVNDVFATAPARTLAARRRQVLARQQDDFRTGNLAVVDGWVLSRTEARLCAAVALAEGTRRVR